MATYAEFIQRAIDTAVAGSDANNNPIIQQRLEAQTLTDLALQAVAAMVAEKPELRARFEKRFSVTLSSGVGTLPAGLLVEYLREGTVRNSDGANNGLGSFLAKVNRFNDFIQDANTALGLYCIVDNALYARDPGSTDYTAASSPIILDAPFVPTTTNLDTEVDSELVNDLVEDVAIRLRGMLKPRADGAE